MIRRRATAWVALGLVVAALVAGPASGHANHVTVDAQVTAGGSVLVETVFAAEEGWLAVHADDEGDPGAVLGARQVESGFRTDVRVEMDDGAASNRTAWVVLHGSDGDGSFDPEEDEPLESFGSAVVERFELAVGDRPAVVTAREFRPQEARDGTVVVRRVAMPSDGHLAVHADAVGPGDVVGSRALAAGTHENVTVPVNDSFLAGEETVTAWAVLHADDGDGTLDAEDAPLRVENEFVGTRFGVRGGPTGATGTPTAATNGARGTAETPTDEERSVVTATPTPTASAVPTSTTGEPTATRGSGPGPGVAGALGALVAFAVAALTRRRA